MAEQHMQANTVLTVEDYAKLMWLMRRTGYLSRSTYIRFLIRKEYETVRALVGGGERAKTNEPSIPAV